MNLDVFKLSKKASEMILSIPKSTRFRVISHYDADGISAAAIICKTLSRQGYEFHASLMRNPFTKGLERLKNEGNEIIIFTDMGSGQIDMIEQLGCKSIIIDHHQYQKNETSKDIIQINANQCGINGNYEASGSSLSLSLAKAVDPDNIDLSDLALIGATGDKQYIGGIRGYNKKILDEALEKNILIKQIALKFSHETILDSLYYSIDPYYSGISGNKDEIISLMNKLNIDYNKKIKDIDKKESKKINSYLLLKLIKQGCENNILDTVIRERYSSKTYNCELERFADLLDSCGKGGNRGLGLAICLGDKKSFNEAINLEKNYKKEILKELINLEQNGFLEKNNYKYFYSKKSSIGGVIGGIAMNYLLTNEKPLFSIVKKDNELHISCRGTQSLVAKGLDLGSAMKKAAIELEGNGGGHKIAAGATIQAEKENDFLELTDKIISKQN